MLPANPIIIDVHNYKSVIFKFVIYFFRNRDGNSMRCENDVKSNHIASSSNIIHVIGKRKRKVRIIKT